MGKRVTPRQAVKVLGKAIKKDHRDSDFNAAADEMVKRARGRLEEEGEAPKYLPIDREESPELYAQLARLIDKYHEELAQARIVLAWHYGWKPDKDGRLTLGKCRKLTELDQRLADFDFVVILNADVWPELNEPQREAILDHELCHAAPALDEEGEQKEDSTGRKCWRVRRHDVEEFSEIVTRHGLYTSELEKLGKAILKRKDAPLFAEAEKA